MGLDIKTKNKIREAVKKLEHSEHMLDQFEAGNTSGIAGTRSDISAAQEILESLLREHGEEQARRKKKKAQAGDWTLEDAGSGGALTKGY
ncbi:MAG: hypothetical protein OXH03_07605 [Bacteroidetes bacterium]|nr:hypothetical protein [Bacteroidota bacterium]MDE2671395.1 hypothetical protein [Bacteroidota bacterium]